MLIHPRFSALAGPSIRRRPRRRVVAGVALLVGSLITGRAFAAGLFLSGEQITTQNITGTTGAPTVYTWDDFNRVVNPLQGTASSGGLVWKPQIGTWLTNGTTARTSTSNVNANVLVDLTTVDASMVVTVTPIGVNGRPGVTFNDDGNNNMLLAYASAGGGTLTLSTYFGPTKVAIATASGIGAPGTPFELRVTSLGPNITVFVNGTLRISQTLTGANLCKFKDTGTGCVADGNPNVGFGLWADTDTVSVFDEFRVESA